jgi:hypothetical protein
METNYHNKYIKYKHKYLQLKKLQNGGKKSERKSPYQSATLYKVGTIKTGNDGNKWIVKVNKIGVKQWKLYKKAKFPNKIHSIKKFDKIASQVAVDNIDDPVYKWIKNKQINDHNFDNYLNVKFKFEKNKTHIVIHDKQIHPEYRLSWLLIFVDGKTYKIIAKNKNSYELLIYKNIKGHTITLSGEVTACNPNSGLLDIDIMKKIDRDIILILQLNNIKNMRLKLYFNRIFLTHYEPFYNK